MSNTQRLRALIEAAHDAGLSYREMSARSGGVLSKSGIQQIATTKERRDLLTREQIEAIARAIGQPARVVRDAVLADAGLMEITGPELPAEAFVLTAAMEGMSEEQRARWVRMAVALSREFGRSDNG